MAEAGAIKLTRRELEVLDLLAEGMTNRQISWALSLSHWTIKRHVARLLEKTATRGRVDLALWYAGYARGGEPFGKRSPR